MSQNLTTVKKRIKTISSTKKITNSMKLVSSIKSRKLANEFKTNTEFYNELVDIFNSALYFDDYKNSANLHSIYLEENNADKNLYIVVLSNLGLCGSYNSEIYKYLKPILNKNDEIIFVGKKCFSYFKNDFVHYDDFLEVNHRRDIDQINLLVEFILEKYRTNKYKNISVVYSHYINSLAFKPSVRKLLPLELKVKKITQGYDPIYESSKEEFVEGFIPQYLKNVILHCFLESALCEETNRRNSMDNANQNIDEIMETLQIEYNKARQASITQEITEIVSGANAIKND
jgi:F-type H+-transporting ATPase subunit gamma